MVRAISATEAQVNVGSMTQQVVDTGDLVIVENHGRPAVAIVPAEKLDRLNELQEQEKRRLALERIRRLQAQVAVQNRDSTAE